MAAAAREVGPVDVLVNNAGGAFGMDTVEHGRAEDWRAMFEVNTIGALLVTQAFLTALRRSPHGTVVVITSTAGLITYEGGGGYTAAKHAETALTETLRLELSGSQVRVVEVCPGMVRDRRVRQHPVPRGPGAGGQGLRGRRPAPRRRGRRRVRRLLRPAPAARQRRPARRQARRAGRAAQGLARAAALGRGAGRGAGLSVPVSSSSAAARVGKSTVARALARRTGAVHVRVDSIEQSLVDAGLDTHPSARAGTARAGRRPRPAARRAHRRRRRGQRGRGGRAGWRAAAAAAGAPLLEVELVCTDRVTHESRVTGRVVDVPGLVPPTWDEVAGAAPEAWTADLRLDTGRLTVEGSVDAVLAAAPWLAGARVGGAVGGTSTGSW